MNSRKVSGLLLILLLLMTSGVVLASTTPFIGRSAIGGGGGQAEASTIKVIGMVGQPVAGHSEGGDISICNGFWCGGSSVYRVFLPLSLSSYVSMFPGPWEQEPNNSYLQANGALYSGQDYYGYPNDEKDYFSFYMHQSGNITIDLTGHTGQEIQLHLYYGVPRDDGSNLVEYDAESPYQITYNGQAGWYYVLVYAAGGYNSTTRYTVQVTYQ